MRPWEGLRALTLQQAQYFQQSSSSRARIRRRGRSRRMSHQGLGGQSGEKRQREVMPVLPTKL